MSKAASTLYDICSIEADIYESNGIVGDVENVSGIAVSNSEIEEPAFSAAKRMQIVQCFTEHPGELDESRKDIKMAVTIEDLSTVPIDLLKQTIKMRDIHPNQLFVEMDLTTDRVFGKIMENAAEAVKKVDTLTKELEDSKKATAEAVKKGLAQEAKELFSQKLAEKFNNKKISEKQKTYLADNFNPENFESVDDASIETYFKTAEESFQKVAKLFGQESSLESGGGKPAQELKDESLEEAFAEED
jgi:hypothetical protein